MSDDDDITNDYHVPPTPKGPSVMPPSSTQRHPSAFYRSATERHKPPKNETDRERIIRIHSKGFLGMTPADFEWLINTLLDKTP